MSDTVVVEQGTAQKLNHKRPSVVAEQYIFGHQLCPRHPAYQAGLETMSEGRDLSHSGLCPLANRSRPKSYCGTGSSGFLLASMAMGVAVLLCTRCLCIFISNASVKNNGNHMMEV